MCKEWDFVSKGTEISVGRFLSEYFTPLSWGSYFSDEAEVWVAAKAKAVSKVKKLKGGSNLLITSLLAG